MKRRLFIFSLVFLMVSWLAPSQVKRLDRKYSIQYNRLYGKLTPMERSRVARMVKRFETRMIPVSPKSDPGEILKRVLTARAGMKADVAAFLILVQAIMDLDNDLRMIMAEVSAMTRAKQKLRDLIKEINRWISEQMATGAAGDDINNQPVSTTGHGTTLAKIKARTFYTSTYKVPYYKAPPVKPLSRIKGLPVGQLRRTLLVEERNLKILQGILEEISLRLKMVMARRAEFLQTLAQARKRMANSQEEIIDHLE